ncbi:hypothetical protein BGZ60DRAFT_48939 [Tricladium varicosporioides]|nr:hypothetical protein BGZ60DRAFT_48939 [Hymenoscyphus varicosporioides]
MLYISQFYFNFQSNNMTENPQHKDNFDSWCAALGYYKDGPVRNSVDLLKDVSLFTATFESRGEKLPTSQTITGPLTRECARCFLTENDERNARVYFGDVVTRESQVGLAWPGDYDRIHDIMSQIFRLRSFYNYQQRLKREKDEARKWSTGRDASEVSSTSKKRWRAKSTSSIQQTENVRIEDCHLENGLAAIDTYHTLNPWAAPPNRPNSKALLGYIQELVLVSKCEESGAGLTREWLLSPNHMWPTSADKRLQIYMHEHDLYTISKAEVPLGVALYLFQGTHLACLSEVEQYRLSTILCNRVQYHTEQLLQLCYLEENSDGGLQKSGRFKAIWERHVHYGPSQDNEKQLPLNRRQKPRKRAVEEFLEDLNDEQGEELSTLDDTIHRPELLGGVKAAGKYGCDNRTSIPENKPELHLDINSALVNPRIRSTSPNIAMIPPSTPMRPTPRTEFNSTQCISPSSSSSSMLPRQVVGGEIITVGVSGTIGALRTPDYSPLGWHNVSRSNEGSGPESECIYLQHQPCESSVPEAEFNSTNPPTTPLLETILKSEENVLSAKGQKDTLLPPLPLKLGHTQPGSSAENPICLEVTQSSEQFNGEVTLASEDLAHEQTRVYGSSPEFSSLPVSNIHGTSLVYTSVTRDSDEANIENFKGAKEVHSYNDSEDPTQRKTLIVKLHVPPFYLHNLHSLSKPSRHLRVRREVLGRNKGMLNLVDESQPVSKKGGNWKRETLAVGDETICTSSHLLKTTTTNIPQEICMVGSPKATAIKESTSVLPVAAAGASFPPNVLTPSPLELSPIGLGCATKRDGSYAYKPFPESFSTIPSPPLSQGVAIFPNNSVQVSDFSELTDSVAPPYALSLTGKKVLPVLLDVTMPSSMTHAPYVPPKPPTQLETETYNLYFQCSNGAINYGPSYSSTILNTCTLSQFFAFFSEKSGYPLQGLTALRLIASFANAQTFIVRKEEVKNEWKTVKNRLHTLWEVERRRCSAKELEEDEVQWEVLVQTCK